MVTLLNFVWENKCLIDRFDIVHSSLLQEKNDIILLETMLCVTFKCSLCNAPLCACAVNYSYKSDK